MKTAAKTQQLRHQGIDLLDKPKRSFEDEQEAIGYLTQAIESKEVDGTQLSECFLKIGEVYRDRPTKTQDDYNKALEYFKKATEVQGLPSWFTPHNQVEKLALCPEIFGFSPEFGNKDLAWEMHNKNVERQDGADLAVTANGWFEHIEKATGETNPEWIKIGFDYLDKAIEKDCGNLWTPAMYTAYGKGYKYHSPKTVESFNKAREWFEKSIELNVNTENGPWGLIGGKTGRAYFELAELLSDPVRFGFDESLKNTQEGKNKYEEGKAYIGKYGSRGPYSVLESLYVNVWEKRLQYKRIDADLENIKELCEFGRSLDTDRNAALYLFEGVGLHAVSEKTDANYSAIVDCYYKCLLACNETGEGRSWMAEQAAKWAVQIMLDCASEGFPSSARDLESAQKLQSLLLQISKNSSDFNFPKKVIEIIDVYAKSQSVNDLYDTKQGE